MPDESSVDELVLLALHYQRNPSSIERLEASYEKLDDLRRDDLVRLAQSSLKAWEAYSKLPWRQRLFRRPPPSVKEHMNDFLNRYMELELSSYRELNVEWSTELTAIDQIGVHSFDPRYQSAVCVYRSALVRQLNLLEPARARLAEVDNLRDRIQHVLGR
ncbi:MAG: hypothetical protein AABX70_05695 [Nanoarchaeota archaeon]